MTPAQADEYLERAGLGTVMKDAVLLLLENRCCHSPPEQHSHPPQQHRLSLHYRAGVTCARPADPVLFLADYFELLDADQTTMQVRRRSSPLQPGTAATTLLTLRCSARCITSSSPRHSCLPTRASPPPPTPNTLAHNSFPAHSPRACRAHRARGRDNLFQAYALQCNSLRRTLTFGDLLPLAGALLEGLPGHIMSVVKTVRGTAGARGAG